MRRGMRFRFSLYRTSRQSLDELSLHEDIARSRASTIVNAAYLRPPSGPMHREHLIANGSVRIVSGASTRARKYWFKR